MTRMDVRRIGKNFAYMARCLPTTPEDQFESVGKAVLEHHFDNNCFCGPWCKRKDMTDEQRIASERYYRCKVKDEKLYSVLSSIIARFVTTDRLKELAHGMDTNVNESLNNTISYFAPKNRVFCQTRFLQNRVAFAVGITSLGLETYFTRLLAKLSIEVTPAIRHFLQVKDNQRKKRLVAIKTTNKKKNRLKRKFELQQKEEEVAKKQRAKRDGTYQSGGHMLPGGFDGEEQKKEKPSRKDIICPLCGVRGHKTKKSKYC